MKKVFTDPRTFTLGVFTVFTTIMFFVTRDAKSDSEHASDKAIDRAEVAHIRAEAAYDKAVAVDARVDGFDRGYREFRESVLNQLDRIEARLTILGHVGDFPMLPVPLIAGIHSTGYDTGTGSLYVRYLTDDTREPGAIYRYAGVKPGEYLDLVDSPEPIDWIWDNLRVRGTVSGHTRDYELVGIGLGGVPRKAVLREDGEWYVPRNVLSEWGEWVTSGLPEVKITETNSTP